MKPFEVQTVSQTDPFLELEQDATAISAFIAEQNARTAAALMDEDYEADAARAAAILESPDTLNGVSRRGAWLYTFRQTAENPRGVWLRVPDGTAPSPEADWKTVFDVDAFCAKTGKIWHWRGAITAWFDPDRVLLCLSLEGSDQQRLIEFDCGTCAFVDGGFDLGPERLGATWLDRDTLLYGTSKDDAASHSGWPGQIRKVSRGQDPAEAPVFMRAEPDDLLIYSYVVRDQAGDAQVCSGRFLEIGREQVTLHGLGDQQVLPTPTDTTVTNSATHFAYVIKQEGGTPGALMLGEVKTGRIREIYAPSERAAVEPYSILLLQDWMLWTVTEHLRPRLLALDLTNPSAEPVEVSLPEPADRFYIQFYDQVGAFGDGTLQILISGFLISPRSYLFDLKNGIEGIEWTKLYQAPEAFNAAGMEVQLLEAASDDGTLVPYHIVLPAGPRQDLPVLLYGYGGFAVSMSPGYDRLTGAMWLSRGGAYVMAHIRGGSEFGPDWHLQAKGAGRHKAFEDFAAIARDLADRGLSRPERIACHGHSNGGLLTGVMLTRYPEVFGAIWTSVGVYDMTRFHKFPAGRAWIDEYGDPELDEERAWLLDYSPVHNEPEAALPAALIDTSSHDDRVDPSHARRFAAALAAAGHTPFFYEHGDGGHGGGGATTAKAQEQALGYRFLMQALGMS
ncbi:MAG: prolyl oligopeptidase family serine peptidase [Pseudomonadota bacterium]